jgi:hypothetical protein
MLLFTRGFCVEPVYAALSTRSNIHTGEAGLWQPFASFEALEDPINVV